MDEAYLKYYVNQAGSGVGNFYSGPIYQRGYGVGSFLGGLFRSVLPLLKKGSLALGRELISCGTNVMDDIEQKVPVDVAVARHGLKSLSNLKRKVANMTGNGYKGVKKAKSTQSRNSDRAVPKNKKKKSAKAKTKKKTNNTKSKKKIEKVIDSLSDILGY